MKIKHIMNIIIFLLITIGFALIFYFRSSFFILKDALFTKALIYSSPDLSKKLLYRLYIPNIKNTEKLPLVLILHGGDKRGNDNRQQLDAIPDFFLSRSVQKNHPSFVFMPQCPKGAQWLNTNFKRPPFEHYNQSQIPESEEIQLTIRVIEKICEKYPIDTSKIYVIGFSMGGSGTWDIISRHPSIFAAAIPISGVSDTSVANVISQIPIWAFHGRLDSIAPVSLNLEMQRAIITTGGSCKLTIYDNQGHYCVNQALKEPKLIEWLFSQKKRLSDVPAIKDTY